MHMSSGNSNHCATTDASPHALSDNEDASSDSVPIAVSSMYCIYMDYIPCSKYLFLLSKY